MMFLPYTFICVGFFVSHKWFCKVIVCKFQLCLYSIVFSIFVQEMSEAIFVLVTFFVLSAAKMQNATLASKTTSSLLVYPGPTASSANMNTSKSSTLLTTVKPFALTTVPTSINSSESVPMVSNVTSIKSTKSVSISSNVTSIKSTTSTAITSAKSTGSAPILTTVKQINFTTASSINATQFTVRSTSIQSSLSTSHNSTTTMPFTNSTLRRPQPITLKIAPNVSEYGGESTKHYSLTCYAIGSNLPKILPYKLCWFQQGDAGKTIQIKCKVNDTSVTFDKHLAAVHHSTGAKIYCGLTFNKLNPTYYSFLYSKYIDLIAPPVENSSSQLIIALSTFALCLFLSGVLAGFIYRRCRQLRKVTPPPIPEEPSVTSQDNTYTYVPLQMVTFYEAKALAAANKKYKMKNAEPPPLPARPKKHIS